MAPFSGAAGQIVDPVGSIVWGGVATEGDGPPNVGLAGFDALFQCSVSLLQAQIAQSLGQLDLSASVPWGSIPLPASLLALVPMPVRMSLELRGARLELRLTNPYVAGLRWPASIVVGTGGVSLPSAMAVLPGEKRFADIGWQLEINVLTPILVNAPAAAAGSSPQTPGPGRGSSLGSIAAVATVGGASTGSGGGGNWDSSTLTTGAATTSGEAAIAARSDVWTVAVQLNFAATSASVRSDAAAITDFLGTEAGNNLLIQALRPLKAVGAALLSPIFAPAGPIAPATGQAVRLPTFNVQDLLLQDSAGHTVLCLCVGLGNSRAGAAQLVQPFLAKSDFAYGASARLLSFALKARWIGAAGGITVVGETPVELGSNGTGRARVQVTLGGTLSDVAIKAGTDGKGDILRLLGTQRIQLLELWDQNGKQVGDLGALGQPQDQPLLIPVNYFTENVAPGQLAPAMESLLLHLMIVVGFPVLTQFTINSRSLTGFTSSPMQANFVRWSLLRIPDVRAPISGVFAGEA